MSLSGYRGYFIPKVISCCSFKPFFTVAGEDRANSLSASQQDVNGLGRDLQHFCYCQQIP